MKCVFPKPTCRHAKGCLEIYHGPIFVGHTEYIGWTCVCKKYGNDVSLAEYCMEGLRPCWEPDNCETGERP